MEEHKDSKEREVLFNLGSSQLELIGFLLKKASVCYLIGKLEECFFTLKNIKMQIISRLSKDERKKMEQLEKKVIMLRRLCNANERNTYRGKMGIAIEQYEIQLKEYLEVKGFLVPLREASVSAFGKKSAGER